MDREIAIVTGASSGFGLLTSLELANKGFYVVAAMRSVEKGRGLLERADALGLKDFIELYELDVTIEESLYQFKQFMNKIGRVDILVNNAGYAGAGFVEEIPITEYRKQFETNFFGLIQVTQACIPLMRQQRKGKIINVSSISGLVGFPGLSPYVASKHAVEGWSESLRLELKPFGIDISIVEPGSYQTNIWSTGKEVTEKSLSKDSPYYSYMKTIENYLKNSESDFGDPKEVALKIAEISREKEPLLRYPLGKGVKLTIRLKNALPWNAWEKLFLKRLDK